MAQSSEKISIPKPNRYLGSEEFREYLKLVKAISNFNPEDKNWYLSEFKISKISKDELKRIVDYLEKYIGDSIYSILEPYLKNDNSIIFARVKGNYIYVNDDLDKYRKLLTYTIRKFNIDKGQYEERDVLLAWENDYGFSTYRGLYWKLLTLTNIKIQPYASFNFYNITLKSFELRDYQINSIRNWISDVNTVGAGIVKAPTGSGKSVIAILSALEMLKNKPNSKIIYAVNSTTLLRQFQLFAKREDLSFALVSGEINELKSEKDADLIALSISYYNSLKKRNKLGKLKEIVENADLIIIDEAHHLPAESVKSLLLDSPNSIRLGLTATPFREDGKDLVITGLLGRISYSINYTELVQKHYLVPLQYISFVPKIPPKLQRKIQDLEDQKEDMKFAQFYSRLLRLFENSPLINLQIVNKIKEINEFPALVIVRRIAIAKKLSEMLNKNGISSDFVTSKTNLEERIRKIEALKSGKLQTLVATSLADEGLDIPNLRLIVLLTQGKSRIKLVQRIGRVMRPYPGKEKGIILDIAYNHEIFQRQFSKRYDFLLREYNGIISVS